MVNGRFEGGQNTTGNVDRRRYAAQVMADSEAQEAALKNDYEINVAAAAMGDGIPEQHKRVWAKYFLMQMNAGNFDLKSLLEGRKYTPAQLAIIQTSYERVCNKLFLNELSMQIRDTLHVGFERSDLLAQYLLQKYRRGDTSFGERDVREKNINGVRYNQSIGNMFSIYEDPTGRDSGEKLRFSQIAALYSGRRETPLIAHMSYKINRQRAMLAAQKATIENKNATLARTAKVPEGEFVGTPKGDDAAIRLQKLIEKGKAPTIVLINRQLTANNITISKLADGLAKILTGKSINIGTDIGAWSAIVDAQKTNPRFLNNGVADGIPNNALINTVKNMVA